MEPCWDTWIPILENSFKRQTMPPWGPEIPTDKFPLVSKCLTTSKPELSIEQITSEVITHEQFEVRSVSVHDRVTSPDPVQVSSFTAFVDGKAGRWTFDSQLTRRKTYDKYPTLAKVGWKLFKMATSDVDGLGSGSPDPFLSGLPAIKSLLPPLLIIFPLAINSGSYIISTTRELPSGTPDPCCFYYGPAVISNNPSWSWVPYYNHSISYLETYWH